LHQKSNYQNSKGIDMARLKQYNLDIIIKWCIFVFFDKNYANMEEIL